MVCEQYHVCLAVASQQDHLKAQRGGGITDLGVGSDQGKMQGRGVKQS